MDIVKKLFKFGETFSNPIEPHTPALVCSI